MKIFTILLVLLCTQVQAKNQKAAVFRFCYQDQTLPPFFLGTGYQVPDKRPGIIIELLKMLEQQIPSLTIHFARAPWKRCLQGLKRGNYDGVLSAFTRKRLEYGVFPMQGDKVNHKLAASRASYCLYQNSKQQLTWDGIKFVGDSALPIAVPQSYSIIQMLKLHQQNYLEVQSNQQGFKLLQHSRVSSVATLCESGDILIQQHKYGDIQRNKTILEQHSGYLLISSSFQVTHPALTSHIWLELSQLRHRATTMLLHQYSYEHP